MISNTPSKTLALHALEEVTKYLSETNAPDNIIQVAQHALDKVVFEHNADDYLQDFLSLRRGTGITNITSRESEFFKLGFNFCQEEMEYVFGEESE